RHSPVEHEPDALLPRAELQTARERGAVPDGARAGPFGRARHEARREMARALALDFRVLPRDRSRLDVRLLAEHEEGGRAPRAGNPAPRVGALYAREAHVIVHEELPGGGAVVGPGAMLLPIVVPIRGMRADVEHGPVGDVPEQEVRVLGHVFGLVQRRDLDESLLVALSGDVPELA